MLITDAASTILRVNRAFTDITGYTAEAAVGQNPRLLKSGRHDASLLCRHDGQPCGCTRQMAG